MEIIPGISDHNIVYIETSLKPKSVKQPKRKIFIYKKANWDRLKKDLEKYMESFPTQDQQSMMVEEMWQSFVVHLNKAINIHIPLRWTNGKTQCPFITKYLARLMRKRDKYHFKAKKTRDPRFQGKESKRSKNQEPRKGTQITCAKRNKTSLLELCQ